MEELSFVGKRVPRKDGTEKATGKALYTVDMVLPGMLWGKILRSPYPHAKILRIDTSRAERLPGVKAVLTGKDTLGIKHGFVETPRYAPDQYPLAMDRVRYIGEEVAAVAAIDEYVAEEALNLIQVDYEELPAVFDPEEAMKPEAPEIHPSHPKVKEPYKNIGGKTESGWGNVEKGFAESFLVREDRFDGQLRTHCYMEPQATLASFDFSGKLNVWTSSQGPFIKRAKLATTLGLPFSNVRVLKAYVGGAYGGKVDLFSHEFCASLLSIKAQRPVKIVCTREEVFEAARHGQPIFVELKTGVKKDGTLVAQQVRVINNSGGYRGSGVVVIFLCWGFVMLCYRIPNLKYEGYSVYTNNPVRAPQRGHGAPNLRFAVESQMDMIAEELGIDPVEIRLKNARQKGDILPNQDPVRNCGLVECIEKVAGTTQFKEKYGRNRSLPKGKIRKGIGMGVSSYFSGSLIYPNASAAIVKLNDDGTVSLITGALDIGQGAETILSQIVAEELGVSMEDIRVVAADTETTPVDIGSWISGGAYVSGNAVKLAASDARRQLFEVAAQELEANPEDLVVKNREISVKDSPGRSISFTQAVAASIAKRRGNPIIGQGHYRTMKDVPAHPSLATTKGRWSDNYAFDAQVAEVEVDMETGQVKLVKATTAHDCGFPINPLIVEGQIDGQVSMAQGHALWEEVLMEKGETLTTSFLDYKIPCAKDMVESYYVDIITERYEKDIPYHTKEVGEGYVSGMVAAIANAVYDATGVRVKTLPILPEKILLGLRKNGDS
ncbi:MAG TPA: xanthine dehydrogenase family protein molybdopterin-binding subunit [Thermodesulfobacteriota bacterium]|nr:xanthine dehydrogenase family protein molybdopterin-binding subunit [Thermodesulfobacteriota bacterium]